MSASKQDLAKEMEQTENQNPDQAPIRVNGFDQVLQMLRIADPEFRESLLRRMAARDPRLVATLRRDLRDLGL